MIGGPSPGLPVPAPAFEISLSYAPDGTALVARIGTDDGATNWWLPLDGSPATKIASGSYDWVDVQRLAP